MSASPTTSISTITDHAIGDHAIGDHAIGDHAIGDHAVVIGDHAIGDHAVVIGGSIAGLLSARVLTQYFARVTVIERDHLPDAPTFRTGAPHARHAHGLLVRGQEIMEGYALVNNLTIPQQTGH